MSRFMNERPLLSMTYQICQQADNLGASALWPQQTPEETFG